MKPEFFEDEKMTDCSRDARLLYMGLWCHMDLNGVTECSLKLIKSRIFPHDLDMGAEKISALLLELTSKKRLIFFEFKGEKLLFCPALKKHQHFHHKEKKKWEIPLKVLLELGDVNDGQLDLIPDNSQNENAVNNVDPGLTQGLPPTDPHLKERKGKEVYSGPGPGGGLPSANGLTEKRPIKISNPRIPSNPPPPVTPYQPRSMESENMVQSLLSKFRNNNPEPEGA